MAIQLAADIAPNGARQAVQPDARAPPPPGRARRRVAKVDSQTVRKHRTWRQRPDGHRQHRRHHRAAGTGQVASPVDPGGVQAEGLLHRGDPAFAHPHARRRPDRWTARRCRRARVRHRPRPGGRRRRSARAGSTINRRPRADRPTPESTERCSNRSGPRGGRGRGRSGSGTGLPADGSPVGVKSGSQTSSWCSKRTATSCPMATSAGSQSTIMVVSRTPGSSASATTAMT